MLTARVAPRCPAEAAKLRIEARHYQEHVQEQQAVPLPRHGIAQPEVPLFSLAHTHPQTVQFLTRAPFGCGLFPSVHRPTAVPR